MGSGKQVKDGLSNLPARWKLVRRPTSKERDLVACVRMRGLLACEDGETRNPKHTHPILKKGLGTVRR